RGTVLGRAFAHTPNGAVAYLCDVDAQVLAKAVAKVGEGQAKSPKGLGDFRRALDDKSVDALVIAAPDHWHTPAALLAMQAGKHVYVEKPCGHNAREGELLVEAQRKHQRVVQLGTQHRSASPRSGAAITSTTTGSSPTPRKPASSSRAGRPSSGRAKAATG